MDKTFSRIISLHKNNLNILVSNYSGKYNKSNYPQFRIKRALTQEKSLNLQDLNKNRKN